MLPATDETVRPSSREIISSAFSNFLYKYFSRKIKCFIILDSGQMILKKIPDDKTNFKIKIGKSERSFNLMGHYVIRKGCPYLFYSEKSPEPLNMQKEAELKTVDSKLFNELLKARYWVSVLLRGKEEQQQLIMLIIQGVTLAAVIIMAIKVFT